MVAEQYVWFVWSIAFLVPWLMFFVIYPGFRKAMLWSSIFTTPFGLTEPLFVPEYWSPPSLFDLALTTGFDIESLIFCFGIGGVGSVLYNMLTGTTLETVDDEYRRLPLHRHHVMAFGSPFVAFPILWLIDWNPIYPGIAAMAVGALACVLCRPDLKLTTWIGGLVFLAYYWIFLEGLEWLSPGYLAAVWNMDDLSGYTVSDKPIEELAFAWTFGMYWAGVYAHFTWRRPVIGQR